MYGFFQTKPDAGKKLTEAKCSLRLRDKLLVMLIIAMVAIIYYYFLMKNTIKRTFFRNNTINFLTKPRKAPNKGLLKKWANI